MADTELRLRRDVFDDLTKERGALTIKEQAQLADVSTRTINRLRGGESPGLRVAMRVAKRLGVPVAALFEEVEASR